MRISDLAHDSLYGPGDSPGKVENVLQGAGSVKETGRQANGSCRCNHRRAFCPGPS
jgi:hypothetical protein